MDDLADLNAFEGDEIVGDAVQRRRVERLDGRDPLAIPPQPLDCLRAADGALCWRFRVAPEDRRMVAYDQLESAWPASASSMALSMTSANK